MKKIVFGMFLCLLIVIITGCTFDLDCPHDTDCGHEIDKPYFVKYGDVTNLWNRVQAHPTPAHIAAIAANKQTEITEDLSWPEVEKYLRMDRLSQSDINLAKDYLDWYGEAFVIIEMGTHSGTLYSRYYFIMKKS